MPSRLGRFQMPRLFIDNLPCAMHSVNLQVYHGLVLPRVLKAIGHTAAECELGNATEELEGLAPAC